MSMTMDDSIKRWGQTPRLFASGTASHTNLSKGMSGPPSRPSYALSISLTTIFHHLSSLDFDKAI